MLRLMAKEKTLIQGNISNEIKAKFDRQLEEWGFNVGTTVERLVRFWVALDPEVQRDLYSAPESIAAEVSDAIAAQADAEKQKHKKDRQARVKGA